MSELSKIYLKTKPCIVKIIIRNADGDLDVGTGFHIGDGLVVTARHVLRHMINDEERDNEVVSIERELDNEPLQIDQIYVHADNRVDLAILETDFNTKPFPQRVVNSRSSRMPFLKIAWTLDEWLDDDFILSKVLIMGYPGIPQSTGPFLVTAEAEVNALIDTYNGPHRHLVISSLARGGFSGGPVISEDGYLLGIITSSLYGNYKPEETGFCVAISVEPLCHILISRKPEPTFLEDDILRKLRRRMES